MQEKSGESCTRLCHGYVRPCSEESKSREKQADLASMLTFFHFLVSSASAIARRIHRSVVRLGSGWALGSKQH